MLRIDFQRVLTLVFHESGYILIKPALSSCCLHLIYKVFQGLQIVGMEDQAFDVIYD